MEHKILIRQNTSMRNHISWIIWPILAIPALNYLFFAVWNPSWARWWIGLIIALLLLSLPFAAWVKSKLYTYLVTESTVSMRKGILSKRTYEVRIADIRGVNIQQGLFQRLMGVGQVGFSSAAGGGEEVTFIGIRNPEHVRRIVQQRMFHLKDSPDSGKTTGDSDE